MKVVAIIPARSGSKGVPKKNIHPLAGYPLIAYSVLAGKLAGNIDRVIVSTDSQDIADTAARYGAEVPFLRPAALAGDKSTDLEFIQHTLAWFQENEGAMPDYLVHLRPTTPLRDAALVEAAIHGLISCPDATSLRSAHEMAESPHKVFQMPGRFLTGFFPGDPRPEYYNLPRQSFPKAYYPNGYVDIIRTSHVISTGTLHGPRMLGFVTPVTAEVDRPEDFDYLEFQVARQSNPILTHLREKFPEQT